MTASKSVLKIIAVSFLVAGFTGLAPFPAEALVEKAAAKAGITVYSNDKASVDASNLAEGYITVKYTGGRDVKLKVQIAKQGGTTYTYDLNAKGTAETFPLTEGDGKYTVGIFENIAGSKYAQAYSAPLDMKLRDGLLPFLYANQYVNFKEGSAVDKKAEELAKTAGETAKAGTEELEVLTQIYKFVTGSLTYDTELAAKVQPGYLPDVEQVLANKKGICFDYAALMSAMLRLEGIPSKLVIGYAGTIYHAWINVYIEDVGWIDQAVYFDGKQWSLMDPTFVSTANSANAVKEFVGEGNSYSQKFAY